MENKLSVECENLSPTKFLI